MHDCLMRWNNFFVMLKYMYSISHFAFNAFNESDVVSVGCFGVRFSVMFHFMFVHNTFSSVWVAEWPPFGK